MEKTIIITGTSSGLGKAIFDELVPHPVHLYCISRKFPAYQEALKISRGDITLARCDLGDVSAVGACTSTLSHDLKYAREVIFIHNAASIHPMGLIGELDNTSIIASVHINFTSGMILANELCRLDGSAKIQIITVTTGAADHPIVGWPLYCSTKAATKMFFDVLEKQEAASGRIRVCKFDPGVMDTKMQDDVRNAATADFPRHEEFVRLKKEGKLANPRDVASQLVQKYIASQVNPSIGSVR